MRDSLILKEGSTPTYMAVLNENGEMVSKMFADQIRWDTTVNKWQARRYYIRTIDGLNESVEQGKSIDTTLSIHPDDFNLVSRKKILSSLKNQSTIENHIPKLFDERRKLNRETKNLEIRFIKKKGNSNIKNEKKTDYSDIDAECNSCHFNWNSEKFDHKVTGLILDEDHIENDCEDCHIERSFSTGPTCDNCHDDKNYPEDKPGKIIEI